MTKKKSHNKDHRCELTIDIEDYIKNHSNPIGCVSNALGTAIPESDEVSAELSDEYLSVTAEDVKWIL